MGDFCTVKNPVLCTARKLNIDPCTDRFVMQVQLIFSLERFGEFYENFTKKIQFDDETNTPSKALEAEDSLTNNLNTLLSVSGIKR